MSSLAVSKLSTENSLNSTLHFFMIVEHLYFFFKSLLVAVVKVLEYCCTCFCNPPTNQISSQDSDLVLNLEFSGGLCASDHGPLIVFIVHLGLV